MRLNVGGAGPFNKARKVYDFSEDLQDLYSSAKKASKGNDVTAERAFADSLAAHPELTRKLNQFDHLLFTLIAKADVELAFHNFGGAIWVDGTTSPYIDNGIIIPFFGIWDSAWI